MTSRVGTTFGRDYLIEEPLGKGGTGSVYLATNSRLGGLVALKILDQALCEDEQARSRFFSEAAAAAGIGHPNIIPIHERGESDGVLFISMKYVRGGDLENRIQEGALRPAKVVEILEQIGWALDAAHDAEIVHCDVKPENILLDRVGGGRDHAYLTDFGVARLKFGARNRPGWQASPGTLAFMAPEQRDGGRISPAVDVYALACVAYECFTGGLPSAEGDGASRQPVHALRPDLPAQVDRVLEGGLAADPNERYSTCEQLTAALGTALSASSPGKARRSRETVPDGRLQSGGSPLDSSPLHRRRTAVLIGLACALLGVAVALGAVALHRNLDHRAGNSGPNAGASHHPDALRSMIPRHWKCTFDHTPPGGAVETAHCIPRIPPVSNVDLSLWNTKRALNAKFNHDLAANDVADKGSCGPDRQWGTHGLWSHSKSEPGMNGMPAGHVLCYITGGAAGRLEWTNTDKKLLVIASGSNHNMVSSWWAYERHQLPVSTSG